MLAMLFLKSVGSLSGVSGISVVFAKYPDKPKPAVAAADSLTPMSF
jgi:hypothetical protein